MLVAQITDCHIVEPGELLAGRVDSAALLRKAVAHIVAMDPRPDVVLATGDLVNDGRRDQYDHLVSILDELPMPLYPVPGNHDDRDNFRAAFPKADLDCRPGPYVDYTVDDHPVRFIGLDTTVPGEHGGRCSPEQLEWLDTELGRAPDRPTVVFQHHPPFATGIAWMDRTIVENGANEAALIARHDQVLLVTCGHLHRVIHTRFARTVAACWPSTGTQLALALDGTPFGYADEPPAVAVHLWDGSALVSHVSYVDGPEPWFPSWASTGH